MLVALELGLLVVPSTLVYGFIALQGSAVAILTLSLPALLVPFGGVCLALVWYAALTFLTGGRAGLTAIHPRVALIGTLGLVWVALSWILPRIDVVEFEPDGQVAIFVFFGGVLATPSALVGLHLLLEWIVARRRRLGHHAGHADT